MLAGGGISTPSLGLGMVAAYDLFIDTSLHPRASDAGGGSSTALAGMIRGVFERGTGRLTRTLSPACSCR